MLKPSNHRVGSLSNQPPSLDDLGARVDSLSNHSPSLDDLGAFQSHSINLTNAVLLLSSVLGALWKKWRWRTNIYVL